MSWAADIIWERGQQLGVKLSPEQIDAILQKNWASLDRAIGDWAEDFIHECADATPAGPRWDHEVIRGVSVRPEPQKAYSKHQSTNNREGEMSVNGPSTTYPERRS